MYFRVCHVCGRGFSEDEMICIKSMDFNEPDKYVCMNCARKMREEEDNEKKKARLCKHYKPYMKTLRKIVGGYYELEGCCSGGPLHIMLDDDNYDIDSVHWCMRNCFDQLALPKDSRDYDYGDEAYILGIMICNEYAKMSINERGVFDSYICGHPIDQCCGNCSECDLLGEFREEMIEKEKKRR